MCVCCGGGVCVGLCLCVCLGVSVCICVCGGFVCVHVSVYTCVYLCTCTCAQNAQVPPALRIDIEPHSTLCPCGDKTLTSTAAERCCPQSEQSWQAPHGTQVVVRPPPGSLCPSRGQLPGIPVQRGAPALSLLLSSGAYELIPAFNPRKQISFLLLEVRFGDRFLGLLSTDHQVLHQLKGGLKSLPEIRSPQMLKRSQLSGDWIYSPPG